MLHICSTSCNAAQLEWATAASAKGSILLLTAICVHISLSPPNPPVKSAECYSGVDKTHSFFEIFVRSITFCSKAMVWVGTVFEIGSILAAMDGLSGPLSQLHYVGSLVPHPLMIIGALSTLLGALLRLWCFRTLGPFFTFEISLRPKHELVTHGPYAWVRHPSYTGVYMTLLGASLVHSSPSSSLVHFGLHNAIGMVFLAFWVLKCCLACRGMCARIRMEDEILKEEFGQHWIDYAGRVPYQLLPTVL